MSVLDISCLKKLLMTILVSILLPGNGGVQAEEPPVLTAGAILNLSDAQAIALERNALIRSATESRRSAEYERNSARAEMRPIVSAGFSYTGLAHDPYIRLAGSPPIQTAASNEYQWNVRVVQPIFTGFALSTRLEMAGRGVVISEVEEKQARLDVIKGVTSAYYSVLLARKLLAVADEAVRLLESHQQDSQRFHDQGVIRLNELLRVSVALADAEQRQEAAAAGVEMTVSNLNRWLSFDINRQTSVRDVHESAGTHLGLEEVLLMGMENRPLLQAMNLTLQNLRSVELLEKSAKYPQVTLIGGYQRLGDDWSASNNDFTNNHNAFISLNARWTLFDSSRVRSKCGRARADAMAFEEVIRSARDGVRLEIKHAFLQLQVAEKNIETARRSVEQAEENLRVTLLGFSRRVATSTEVLDARTDLTMAKTNLYRSVYGHLDAMAGLERAVGMELSA